MHDAVEALVRDGDTVAIEGFTHLICFAAGHEIIRQRRRDLTLCRLTPDVVYDQMIGAGVASKLVFSWLGNPGVGSLHAIRRRIEHADPAPLEIEEYSHFGMVCRYVAGASNLPFFPIRSYYESDIPKVNPNIRSMVSPYEDATEIHVVPPLKPDVAIVHAQRADAERRRADLGAAGLPEGGGVRRRPRDRGVRGDGRGVGDPRRPQPHGDPRRRSSTPWSRSRSRATRRSRRATTTATTRSTWRGTRSRATPASLDAWLDEWVYGLANHAEYVEKMGAQLWDSLRPAPAMSGEVDYGRYA